VQPASSFLSQPRPPTQIFASRSYLYLVGDSDACVEIDSTPLLKPSSRGPLRGGSQDMATTYKMGHLDDRSCSFSKCMSLAQFSSITSAMMINLEIGNRTTSAAVGHPQDGLSGCAWRDMARLSTHMGNDVLIHKVCSWLTEMFLVHRNTVIRCTGTSTWHVCVSRIRKGS
jgi:hypothetical protein